MFKNKYPTYVEKNNQISFHENQFSSNLAVLIKYYLKSHYNLYFDQLGKYSWHRDLVRHRGAVADQRLMLG